MGRLTQENRFISITDFSLGADTFVITSLRGTEYISGLFEFELELYSDNHQIPPEKVVGKSATVKLHNDQKRCFNGYIKKLSLGEVGPHNHRQYRMTMVPWLWLLSKTNNCRIFQEKNTKDIVTQVFGDLGFTDFDFKASPGEVREYCVQYNESDFHFISRLLEEDGISYYFEHTEGRHRLLLVDQANAFKEVAETNLEYSRGTTPDSHISRWEHLYDFKKGQWTLSDYNFKEPKKDLKASTKTSSSFANNSTYEHYEYPGLYNTGAGKELAKIRLEAEESLRNSAQGASDCSSFYAGGMFKLAKHATDSEKDSYVIVAIEHNISDRSFFAGEEGSAEYGNSFMCIPADVQFRPDPVHQRPVMRGPQSALVVGPVGEEIYIDEHARIKVQFYWDREGQRDENSTCFIRVVQSWAGNQWGTSFIPRVGHEVVVDFLDGDPDRPLVTGSVYNGWNKPVYSSKTQSGIKSRSTKGGNAQNYNELRFEDKKGSEQVYIHAERDFDAHVENNQTLTVENDQTITIENNRSKSIGNNETYEVKANRSKSVGGSQDESIGKNKTTDVAGDHVESIGKNMNISIEKDLTEKVNGSYTEKVTKDSLHSAKTITFKADKQITLQTGSAKIVMKSNGDITISGKNINVKGSGNVVLKGSKVTAN